MNDLKAKSIIITGGGSGIGRAAALMGARAGARVTIVDINGAAAKATFDQVKAEGGDAQVVDADISDEEQVKTMVAAAVAHFGTLAGAFNNAGVPPSGNVFHETSLDTFRSVQAINLIGTFLSMKYEISAMLKTDGRAIVNTSSSSGILADPTAADYMASKHGIIGLTKSAALDYATKGIRVNAVLPGLTRTPMLEKALADSACLAEWYADRQPIKRMGEANEVAAVALWLLTDAASLVTGVSMPVDGGYSMV